MMFFSATLFYIVKNRDRPLLLNDVTVKRRIITTLLTGMDFHNYDETMMRNGCLTLCQLRIPQDVVSTYCICQYPLKLYLECLKNNVHILYYFTNIK